MISGDVPSEQTVLIDTTVRFAGVQTRLTANSQNLVDLYLVPDCIPCSRRKGSVAGATTTRRGQFSQSPDECVCSVGYFLEIGKNDDFQCAECLHGMECDWDMTGVKNLTDLQINVHARPGFNVMRWADVEPVKQAVIEKHGSKNVFNDLVIFKCGSMLEDVKKDTQMVGWGPVCRTSYPVQHGVAGVPL